MTTFFSDDSLDIINDMSICLVDLESKVLGSAAYFKDIINNLFELLKENDGALVFDNSNLSNPINLNNREEISHLILSFAQESNIVEDTDEYLILDSIRHAYINYQEGGILQMYLYREAEVWYPKIEIANFMGILEDVMELDEFIEIYRGTSREEFNRGKFGQSWSLNRETAEGFAFVHYKTQPDYIGTERVVLKR